MENTENAAHAAAEATPAVSATERVMTKEDYIQDAFKAALEAEGLVKKAEPAVVAAPEPAATEPVAPAPEAAPPVEAAPSTQPEDPLGRSFEKLAREKAEFRKEMETYKNEIEAIKRAKASRDPLSVLAATGFTYNDVVERVLASNGTPKVEEKPEVGGKQTLSEASELKARLERLEQYEAQQQRSNILNQAKSFIKPDKFPLTAQMGDFEAVMQVITDFHNRTGTLPGQSFAETVEIAAEQVEKYHKTNAERYAKLMGLTPPVKAPNITPEPTRDSAAGQVSPGKTLTNRTAPVAAARPAPQTREDYLADLLADPNFK